MLYICGCVFYLVLPTMIGHKYYSPDHTDEETSSKGLRKLPVVTELVAVTGGAGI